LYAVCYVNVQLHSTLQVDSVQFIFYTDRPVVQIGTFHTFWGIPMVMVMIIVAGMSLTLTPVDIEDGDVIFFSDVWAGQYAIFAKAYGSLDIYACGHNHRSQLG